MIIVIIIDNINLNRGEFYGGKSIGGQKIAPA
jgi:hypothetical protein